MKKVKSSNVLDEYTPVGKKDCQGMCERKVIITKEGPVVLCDGCQRIVMDNREKK